MKYDMFSVRDKVICITGGSGGIGAGLAEGLVQMGAEVVILGRNEKKLELTAQNILRHTGKAVQWYSADITNEEEVNSTFKTIFVQYGALDGLVNSAGVTCVSPLSEMSMEDWQTVMDTNLKGTVICCKAAGKYMALKRKGNIVNISSLAATHGKPGYTAYTPSKAALNAFTFTLAAEWAHIGINVNSVSPAIVVTEMNRKKIEADPEYLNKVLSTIPNGKACGADELLGIVTFLLSPASAYITGQNIGCDGGAENGDVSVLKPVEWMREEEE